MFIKKLKSSLKGFPLSIHYLIFATFILIIIASVSLLKGISDYRLYLENQKRTLEDSAYKIQNSLASLFDNTLQIQMFIGKQITEKNYQNLNDIVKLFKNYREIRKDASILYTWPGHNWINSDLIILANTAVGPIKPLDLSYRKYLQNTKKMPWKLFISEPAIGSISSEKAISLGVGITSHKGIFLGSIVISVNIDQLTKMLRSINKTLNTNFAVIDHEGNIIACSKCNSHSDKDVFKSAIRNKNINLLASNENLKQSIEYNQINYSYSYKVKGYPYYILTGYDNTIVMKEFFVSLIPKILELLGLGAMCLILLVFFKHWFIKPVQALSDCAINLFKEKPIVSHYVVKSVEFFYIRKSLISIKRYLQKNKIIQTKLENLNYLLKNKNDELVQKRKMLEESEAKLLETINISRESDIAKEKFLKQVNIERKTSIRSMLESSKKMMVSINQTKINDKEIYFHIKRIYYATMELKAFARTNINLELIHLNEIIESSVKIHNKITYVKNIEYKIITENDSILIYADKFRLKQAIVSLLYKAIQNTCFNGSILIECKKILLEDEHSIQIKIEDFGQESNSHPTQSSLVEPMSDYLNVLELELETIDKLVQFHGGTIKTHTKKNGGQKVMLVFPIRRTKLLKEKNNIYKIDTYRKHSN